MKLYGSRISPFTRHCRIALHGSGLEYEFIEKTAAEIRGISPTARIPYFDAGSFQLSDSSSILHFVRSQAGGEFMANARDFDLYCLSNTVIDSAICVLMNQRLDGVGPSQSQYLSIQASRIESCLSDLEQRELSSQLPLNEGEIRLACLLEWGLYRQVFSLEPYPRLRALLALAQTWETFRDTAPPREA